MPIIKWAALKCEDVLALIVMRVVNMKTAFSVKKLLRSLKVKRKMLFNLAGQIIERIFTGGAFGYPRRELALQDIVTCNTAEVTAQHDCACFRVCECHICA